MRTEVDREVQALMPTVRAVAGKIHRRMPANVERDDLVAAGMLGAWEAVEKFDGRGSMPAFAAARIRQRIFDELRTLHPAGRNGPQVTTVDIDEIEFERPEHGDPTADAYEARQTFNIAMRAMPPRKRRVVEQMLAGQRTADIGERLGVSASRVSQLAAQAVRGKPRQRTPDTFDPAAVPLEMNVPVPPPTPKRRNRFKELVDATPAGGSRLLGTVQAKSFVSELKKAGVAYVARQITETTVRVWREPTPEQLQGSKSWK